MSSRERLIVIPALIVFTLHGLLYYVFPEQNYAVGGNGGWIAYVKYLCILIALPSMISPRFPLHAGVWVGVGLLFFLSPLPLYLFWAGKNNVLLLQYQLAVLGYFFAPAIARALSEPLVVQRSIFAVLLISLAATASEFLVGGVFGVFSRSGFRGVGPFVNPNNTGIVIGLLAGYYHYRFSGYVRNLLVALLAIVILIMTGSKTAILIYALAALVAMPSVWRLVFVVIIPLIVYVNYELVEAAFRLMSLRDFSLESGAVRSVDAGQVLKLLGRLPLKDVLFGFSNESLVDNAYLDMICYGGVYLLALFLFAQIASMSICIRSGRRPLLLMHGLLVLAMLTTDVPRLWPTGYVFWMLVGMSAYGHLRQKKVSAVDLRLTSAHQYV